jgi:hypothetical protein
MSASTATGACIGALCGRSHIRQQDMTALPAI